MKFTDRSELARLQGQMEQVKHYILKLQKDMIWQELPVQ